MSPHRRPVPLWYALLAVLLSVLAISLATLAYTAHVRREADRRWCGLIGALDDAYSATPPQSELGRQVAAELARLRQQFDCP